MASSLINDNHSCFPTQRNLGAQGLEAVVKDCLPEQTLNCQSYKQSVSCIDVVNPVPTVIIQGRPQKKGLRPGLCLNRIKLVKGVSCVSMSFCPICSICPTCCHRDQCWEKASELLASLAKVGFKSQGGVSSEGRIFSSIQGKATTQPLSLDCEQI